jgi:hypothetical protein
MSDTSKKAPNLQGFEEELEFAKAQEKRHDWRTTTTNNFISALRAVISVMDENEPRTAEYVLENLDDLLRRWVIKTDGKQSSAKDYRKRVTTFLTEHRRYKADPLNFKTAVEYRTSKRRPKATAAKSVSKPSKSPPAPPPVPAEVKLDEFAIEGRGSFKWTWDGEAPHTAADAQRFAYYLVLKATDFAPPPIVRPAADLGGELEDGS